MTEAKKDDAPAQGGKGGKKKMIIVIAAILAVLITGAGGGYFYMQKQKETAEQTKKKKKKAKAAAEEEAAGDEEVADEEAVETDGTDGEATGEETDAADAETGGGEEEAAADEESTGEEEAAAEEEGGEEGEEETAYLPLAPAFVVNFQPGAGGEKPKAKFLSVEIEAVPSSAELAERIKTHMPAIRNAVILLLSRQTYETLITPEGKEALRNEVLLEIQKVLKKTIRKKGIREIYFTSFVMQ
ncbi:MAG: hypothetical protein NFCOHLIN_03218 [Gammaproteobacteria bacterium]|nr:hypothetical protein [Gammaproteobacteria bacterium]